LVRSPSTMPREVIISHTYRPAPCSRHSLRNGALVTPAMGASTTGVGISRSPSRSGRPMVSVAVIIPFSHPDDRSPQEPAVLIGDPHRLGTGTRTGLADGTGEVVTYRALRQLQLACDVGDRAPAACRSEGIGLSLGQGRCALGERVGRQLRIHDAHSRMHPAYGICELTRQCVFHDE